MKDINTVETEIRDYVKKLRKNRGEVISVECKFNRDYYPKAKYPDYIVGGFVSFSSGERIFVYRYENKVNNYNNNRGYGTYSGYNSDRKVSEVVVGWNVVGSCIPGEYE